jgi:hypothetical protein
MSERSLFSRILRAFGRLLRRLTIATGALILILYFSGDWILDAWPTPACAEWPKSSLANARGDVAEITVHGCLLGIVNRQYLLRVRPAGDVSGKLLVRFKPKDSPALIGSTMIACRWISAESAPSRRRSRKPDRCR